MFAPAREVKYGAQVAAIPHLPLFFILGYWRVSSCCHCTAFVYHRNYMNFPVVPA
jgi:hypothetical protein